MPSAAEMGNCFTAPEQAIRSEAGHSGRQARGTQLTSATDGAKSDLANVQSLMNTVLSHPTQPEDDGRQRDRWHGKLIYGQNQARHFSWGDYSEG